MLYSRRWDIEVFFRTCKEYLGFAKEFQGRSYDSVTAQVAIVFTRYIMLSTTARNNTDMRTAGELFYLVYDELKENSIAQALLILLEYLALSLHHFFANATVARVQAHFLSSLPTFFKDLLLAKGCET